MYEITWADVVRKLTSRKFWLAVAAFVTNLMVFNGGTAESAEKVTSLIIAGATVIAYIIGEGLADSAPIIEEHWYAPDEEIDETE